MKIVVDTNIIFSGLLNPSGTISDILLNSSNVFEFFSPTFVLTELTNHKEKMMKISGYTKNELDFLLRILLKKIDLIDIESIRKATWKKAMELTENVDEFDTPFIALDLEAPLWTGDKKLIKGLSKKGINWILSTDTISRLRDE